MVDTWFSPNVQIGLVSEADFRSNLPEHFNYGLNAKISFDKSNVNVFAGDVTLTSPFDCSSYPQEVMIDSEEQLTDLKKQMLTLPSFMPYHLSNGGCCCGATDHIIYINPKHPKIRGKIEKSFDRCLELFIKGRQFAMEIRFDKSVAAHCRRTFRKYRLSVPFNPIYISVTNTGQRCQEFHEPWIWIFCLPCALLCGLPYCLCRVCTVDFKCQIKGDIEYVTPPQENPIKSLSGRSNVYKVGEVTVRPLDPVSSIDDTATSKQGRDKQPGSSQAIEQEGHDPYKGYRGPTFSEYSNAYTTSVRDPYDGYKARE